MNFLIFILSEKRKNLNEIQNPYRTDVLPTPLVCFPLYTSVARNCNESIIAWSIYFSTVVAIAVIKKKKL